MLNPLEDNDEWQVRQPKRRGPWLYLLVAAALGYAAYHSGGFQGRVNSVVDAYFSKEARAYIQRATKRVGYGNIKLPAPAGPTAEPEPGSVSVTQAPPSRPPEPPKTWTIRVRAYDLLELEPVRGLAVTLRGPLDGRVYAAKPKKGVFEFRVPRVAEGGYHLDVRLDGRKVHFIEDSADVPYREHDAERRAQEADELKSQKVLHVALRADDPSGNLECPIVVLP